MKKAALVLMAFSFIFSSQGQKRTGGYVINGILKNIPDHSIVLLSVDNKNTDSAIVLGEKFKLTGEVDQPTNVYLRVGNTGDYKSFWLENNTIDLIAEKGDFRNAKITGSMSQKEDDMLSLRLRTVEKEMQDLEDFYEEMPGANKDSINAVYNSLELKEATIYQQFIRDYPNSRVSVHVLNVYKTTWKNEPIRELYSLLGKELKGSSKGKSILNFLTLNKNVTIGGRFADFEQKSINGKKIKLSDIKSTYILLDFWASWCGPCREANPDLVEIYKDYKSKGFEILGVSLDQDRNAWTQAIKADGLNWMNVSDLNGSNNEAALIYGVNAIPDNFLINQDGIIIARDLSGKELREKLKELYGEIVEQQ